MTVNDPTADYALSKFEGGSVTFVCPLLADCRFAPDIIKISSIIKRSNFSLHPIENFLGVLFHMQIWNLFDRFSYKLMD